MFADMEKISQIVLKRIAFSILLLAIISGNLIAQEISFSASVNKNPIGLKDHFSFTLTIKNGKGTISNPNLHDFNVLYGPGSSTSIQFVNGKQTSTYSYTYTLSPKKTGDFVLGPFKATINGKTYQSNKINIKVTGGSSSSAVQKSSSGNNNNRNTAEISNVTGTGDLIIKIVLNKSSVYVGESVLTTFILYSRYQALELQEFETPNFNGFWAEELKNTRASWDDKIQLINGKQYRKATLRRMVLIPQHSGNIKIDKIKLSALVNASFFNRGTVVDAISNAPVLKVKPLPDGKPKNFSGAVGTFELSAKASSNQINTNDALNYVIEVKGKGNLKLVNEFDVPFPGDFEKYDPKTSENIKVDQSGMHGTKKWDYLLIPRHAGDYTIPALHFTYFDLKTKKYKTLQSSPIDINVIKGEGSTTSGVVYNNVNKQDFQILDEDIRYINNTTPDLIPNGEYLFGSVKYYILFFTPAILFLLFLFLKRRVDASSKDVVGRKMKKAQRKANKHLKQAEKLIGEGGKLFYDKIFAALYGYIRDRLNMGISELSKEQIRERFDEKKITVETIDELISVLETCEMARFAPIGDVSRKELVVQARDVINQIDKQVG
jgi:hypothetical protein